MKKYSSNNMGVTINPPKQKLDSFTISVDFIYHITLLQIKRED